MSEQQGICGDASPKTTFGDQSFCYLTAGHIGWHEAGGKAGPTQWTDGAKNAAAALRSDMAEAERRGAERVRQRLAEVPTTWYSTDIFGDLSAEDLKVMREAIESTGHTIDALTGYISRFNFNAAAHVASEVIAEIAEENE